jgi:hypothetical protein
MKDGNRLQLAYQEVEQLQEVVDDLYVRWAELEKKIK